MPTVFRPSAGIAQQIERSPQMVAALAAAAARAVPEAQAIARREAYDEGDYHDGIGSAAGIIDGRAAARIIGADFKSWWIEAGSIRADPKRILSRGAEAAGLRIGGTP